MKKIALCIEFSNNNYGTMLQAFANKHIIESFGCEAIPIRYKKTKTVIIMNAFKNILDPIAVSKVNKRISKKLYSFISKDYKKFITRREWVFNNFRRQYFSKCKTYYSYNEMIEHAYDYDAFLVGSDQLWLPTGYKSGFYNLLFVPDDIPKISYATSFGVSKIPSKFEGQARTFLNRLDAVGVREDSGKLIVESLSSQHAEIVCDPTMLLTDKQWRKTFPSEKIFHEKYIFCYFLGNNKIHREEAYRLSKEKKLKIVTLHHLDQFSPSDKAFGDIIPNDIAPGDFINLIRNAEYICTDSFHGTVFSIINHKQFMTFYRFPPNSRHSRNTRIDSLFKILEISRIYDSDIITSIDEKIDYCKVDDKLNDFRSKSLKYLRRSLYLTDQISMSKEGNDNG